MTQPSEASRKMAQEGFETPWYERLSADPLAALLDKRAEMASWTPGQIDAINAEMAAGIIAEIRDTLKELGCCHGHDMASTPPMFYREAILCAMAKAKKEGAEAERERIKKACEDVLPFGCDCRNPSYPKNSLSAGQMHWANCHNYVRETLLSRIEET